MQCKLHLLLDQVGYADTGSLLFSIAYWYVWTTWLPKYRGYKLEDEYDILSDGTTITKLMRRRM